MSTTILMIGGTHDGERIGIDPRQHQIKVASKRPAPVRPHLDWPLEINDKYDVEIYHRRYINAGDIFAVYVIEGMMQHDMMKALIDGYSPRKASAE